VAAFVGIRTMLKPKFILASLSIMFWCLLYTPAFADKFVNLSALAPGSPDVCSAVKTLREGSREAEIAAHSLPETSIGQVADPRVSMTPSAWAQATAGEYGMTHYPDHNFDVARIELNDSGPQNWVFSTSVGSLNNPILWVFSSTQDGSKPDHLVAQLGFEGSGPFDTYFVRFNDQPYAIERFVGEKGSYLDVLRLDPAKVICSFSPP
jgi:hypothetical protein